MESVLDLKSLMGLWSRRSIEWPNGNIDQETRVWWIQANPCFIDLRLPPLAPILAGSKEPQGFAGTLAENEGAWLWDHEIDLHPRPDQHDIASLGFEGGKHRMIQQKIDQGIDPSCTQVWDRIDDGDSTDGQVFIALLQTHIETGMLIALGDHFMYARSGTTVEISHGYRVGPFREWLVSESTDPSREKKRIFPGKFQHIDWDQRVLVEANSWQVIEPAAGKLNWVY